MSIRRLVALTLALYFTFDISPGYSQKSRELHPIIQEALKLKTHEFSSQNEEDPPLLESLEAELTDIPKLNAKLMFRGLFSPDYLNLVIEDVERTTGLTLEDRIARKKYLDVVYMDLYRLYRTLDLCIKYFEAIYFLKTLPSPGPESLFYWAGQRHPVIKDYVYALQQAEIRHRAGNFQRKNWEDVKGLQNALFYYQVSLTFLEARKTKVKNLRKTERYNRTAIDEEISNIQSLLDDLGASYPIFQTETLKKHFKTRKEMGLPEYDKVFISTDTAIKQIEKFGENTKALVNDGLEAVLQTRSFDKPKFTLKVDPNRLSFLQNVYPDPITSIQYDLTNAIEEGIRNEILPNISAIVHGLDGLDWAEETVGESYYSSNSGHAKTRVWQAAAKRNNVDFLTEIGSLNGTGLEIVEGFPEFRSVYHRLMTDYTAANTGFSAFYRKTFGHEWNWIDGVFMALPFLPSWLPKGLTLSSVLLKLLLPQRVDETFLGLGQLLRTWQARYSIGSAYFGINTYLHDREEKLRAHTNFLSSVVTPDPVSYGSVQAFEAKRKAHLFIAGAIVGGSILSFIWGPQIMARVLGSPSTEILGYNPATVRLAGARLWSFSKQAMLIGLAFAVFESTFDVWATQYVRSWSIQASNMVGRFFTGGSLPQSRLIQAQAQYDFMAKNQNVWIIQAISVQIEMIKTQLTLKRLLAAEDGKMLGANIADAYVSDIEKTIDAALTQIAMIVYDYWEIQQPRIRNVLNSDMGFDVHQDKHSAVVTYKTWWIEDGKKVVHTYRGTYINKH